MLNEDYFVRDLKLSSEWIEKIFNGSTEIEDFWMIIVIIHLKIVKLMN
jgi:hypothetical protein